MAAVAEVGSDLNAFVIGCLRWLVGDTDEMPRRPDQPVPPQPPSE